MADRSGSRVWLITGCSTGFGRALAEAAIARGDSVVATARDEAAIRDLERAGDGRVFAARLDVTDRESIHATLAAALDIFGRIDVVVNNAGFGLFGCLEEVSDAQIRSIFAANLFGTMDVLRAVLPVLRRQGAAHILNVTSNGGRFALPGMGLYHATKFAVEGLSEALAQEIAALGIRLTIVEPGGFTTDFNARSMTMGDFMGDHDHVRAYLGSFAAAYRMGDPADAARAMIAIVEMDEPPLRVALGPTAADEITARLSADIAGYRDNAGIWLEAAGGR